MIPDSSGGPVAPPESRRGPLGELLRKLLAARSIILTTHVNADGDGAGSEAALAAWLIGRGKRVKIINPTAFPEKFRFLLDNPSIILDRTESGVDDIFMKADLLFVVDTSEPDRLGKLERRLSGITATILDHHLPPADSIAGVGLRDPSACSTGELVYDLLQVAEEMDQGVEDSPAIIYGIYTAMVTDTGHFQHANTTARTHAIAANLIRRGVDPETWYRRVAATVPLSRLRLLRRALEDVHVDEELPLAWMAVPLSAVHEAGADSDDFEGLVERVATIRDTEVALLMRGIENDRTKVSFRSRGPVDVNRIARGFGGGGHAKASGAVLNEPLETAKGKVLKAARDAIHAQGVVSQDQA